METESVECAICGKREIFEDTDPIDEGWMFIGITGEEHWHCPECERTEGMRPPCPICGR